MQKRWLICLFARTIESVGVFSVSGAQTRCRLSYADHIPDLLLRSCPRLHLSSSQYKPYCYPVWLCVRCYALKRVIGHRVAANAATRGRRGVNAQTRGKIQSGGDETLPRLPSTFRANLHPPTLAHGHLFYRMSTQLSLLCLDTCAGLHQWIHTRLMRVDNSRCVNLPLTASPLHPPTSVHHDPLLR